MVKKILKWSGIGLGVVILAVGGWLFALYLGSGGEYEGAIEDLAPADALVMTRVDNLGARLPEIEAAIERLFEQPQAFRKVESSPFWRSLVIGDEKQVNDPKVRVPTLAELHQQNFKPMLEGARAQVANLPGGLDLYEDLVGKELVFALVPDKRLKRNVPLILTRVSRTVRFGWNFKGFGEGQHGATAIYDQGEMLKISTHSEGAKDASDTYIGLHEDLMAISASRELVDGALKMAAGGGGPRFTALPAYGQAKAQMESAGAYAGTSALRFYANLDGIRDDLGPDPGDERKRAKIDQFFTLSAGMIQMSADIMPPINQLLENSIDTRIFPFAGWLILLDSQSRIEIDQFLIADEQRLRKEPRLQQTWKLDAAPMEFLDLLPRDTWAVVSTRQPFKVIKESIKPRMAEREDGTKHQDAVSAFLDALGPHAPIDSITLALAGNSYKPTWRPQEIVSNLSFPAFALMLHWPRVDIDEVHTLMQNFMTAQGAKSIVLGEEELEGQRYLVLLNPDNDAKFRWLTEFAFVAVKDHFIVTYSGRNSLAADILRLSRNSQNSLRRGKDTPWEYLDKTYSTLVYAAMPGFKEFSQSVKLSETLASTSFNSGNPEGLDPESFRQKIAAEMKLPVGDERVGEAYKKRLQQWLGQKTAFQKRLEMNLEALHFMSDFTAHTDTSTERMHTHMVVRLDSR